MNDEKRNLWLERIIAYRASGLSVRVWCENNQVNINTFRYWNQKCNKESVLHTSSKKCSQWLSVEVSDSEPDLLVTQASSGVTIKLGFVSVEVSPGFDLKTLEDVFHVLKKQC